MEGTSADSVGEVGWMDNNEKLKRELMGDAYVQENVNTKASNGGGIDPMILTETLEALDVGKEAAISLQDQKERLSRSELFMDSTQYVLDKAMVALRGMTFLGSIRNYFSEVSSRLGWCDDWLHCFIVSSSSRSPQRCKHVRLSFYLLFVCPPSKEPVLRRSNDMPDGELLEGFLCSECKTMFEGPDSLRQHYEACHLDGNDVLYHTDHPFCDLQDTTIQAQQEYIDALLPVVGTHVEV